jgi:hypothetical protein
VTAADGPPRPRVERKADTLRKLRLRPERIQAWRESNELAGRQLMRDGEWLDWMP